MATESTDKKTAKPETWKVRAKKYTAYRSRIRHQNEEFLVSPISEFDPRTMVRIDKDGREMKTANPEMGKNKGAQVADPNAEADALRKPIDVI